MSDIRSLTIKLEFSLFDWLILIDNNKTHTTVGGDIQSRSAARTPLIYTQYRKAKPTGVVTTIIRIILKNRKPKFSSISHIISCPSLFGLAGDLWCAVARAGGENRNQKWILARQHLTEPTVRFSIHALNQSLMLPPIMQPPKLLLKIWTTVVVEGVGGATRNASARMLEKPNPTQLTSEAMIHVPCAPYTHDF